MRRDSMSIGWGLRVLRCLCPRGENRGPDDWWRANLFPRSPRETGYGGVLGVQAFRAGAPVEDSCTLTPAIIVPLGDVCHVGLQG